MYGVYGGWPCVWGSFLLFCLGGRGVSIYRLKRALIHRGYTIHCLEAFITFRRSWVKNDRTASNFNEFGKMVTLFRVGLWGGGAEICP